MQMGFKHLRYLMMTLLLLGGAAHAQQPPSSSASARHPLKAASDKLDTKRLSYAIGYQIGSQFADGQPAVDIPTLMQAIQDAYNKRHPSVSMQQMHQQLDLLDQQMHAKALAEFTRVAAANAARSAAFLASNRKRPGVMQLPSGIQYSVIKKGHGPTPRIDSTVVVNYRGMLIDGTEFDSTWAHGAPVSFPVDGVIAGWRDVIPRMHVGAHWKVVIPPQLAYGAHGALPRIGPNEALVFEIELLDIKPASDKQ